MRRRRPTVLKRPLLIVPPWINKFYVLDLNKEKSFIRWAVSQGLTVFVISWVNPDERHAAEGLGRLYARGHLRGAGCASSRPRAKREVATVGYCVGGTLLAATLAYMAAKEDRRVTSVDVPDHAGRFQGSRRPQGLRRRGADPSHRTADGRERLSRRLAHGQRLQHAAAGRPDLVLLGERLPEGQGAEAVRPAGLERGIRPACRPPITPSTCATAISRTSLRGARW